MLAGSAATVLIGSPCHEHFSFYSETRAVIGSTKSLFCAGEKIQKKNPHGPKATATPCRDYVNSSIPPP